MKIKQSVCIPIMKGDIELGAFVAEVAAIGFSAVEIWFRDEQFGELCEHATRHGMKVVSFIGHAALDDGLNNPGNHERIEAELRASIDVAADHGVSGLICFSGNRLEGKSRDAAIADTATGLSRVAGYAESKGVTLNLELLNSKVNHEGYDCDHTAWGLEVVEQVGSSNVKLLYDIYHMQIMEGDVIRTIQDHWRSFGHFHTAGNPGRHELDSEQELNYAAICDAIASTGYEGYVGHEFQPKGDVMAALRQAYELCDRG